jgi:hypothetical protein
VFNASAPRCSTAATYPISDKKKVKRIKSGGKRGKKELKKLKRKFRKFEKLVRRFSKTEAQRQPVTTPWWSKGVNNSLPKVIDLATEVFKLKQGNSARR